MLYIIICLYTKGPLAEGLLGLCIQYIPIDACRMGLPRMFSDTRCGLALQLKLSNESPDFHLRGKGFGGPELYKYPLNIQYTIQTGETLLHSRQTHWIDIDIQLYKGLYIYRNTCI